MSKVPHYKSLWLCALTAVLLLGSACHHPEAAYEHTPGTAWTPSEVETMLGGDDPMEGFNRSMFACTDFAMNYIADPLGRVYTTIFPRFFIEHFHNVCVNLEYPARVMSCLLQAEWRAAGDETIRFFANTTLGIAGIFDVAQYWWNIPSSRAEFGQTFYRWGIGPGETFMLPFVPTVNGRDTLGLIFDSAFDLKTYIPYAGYATALNRMVMAQQSYDQVAGGAQDPYKSFRQALLIQRELQKKLWFYHDIKRQISEFQSKAVKTQEGKLVLPEEISPPPLPQPEGMQGNYLALKDFYTRDNVNDSLRVLFFRPRRDKDKWYMRLSLFNRDFQNVAHINKITLLPERPKARYAFWQAPEVKEGEAAPPERLVILLPGIGGSCNDGALLPLAEYFHEKGCMVLAVDSTFNWRFITADSQCRLPGFLPEDTLRVRRIVVAAMDDLRRRKLIKQPEIIVAGYSLGGLQTLSLAHLEKSGPQLRASRFVAVNPPVSVAHALYAIDKMVAVSAKWDKAEMKKRLISAAGEQMMLASRQYPPFDPANPARPGSYYRQSVDIDTARVMAGLSLKLSLREVLLAAHREKGLPALPEYKTLKRHELYRAIDKVSLLEYAVKYLAPQYPGVALTELMRSSSLYSIADTLRSDPKVRIVHTWDDFLLSSGERAWLDRTLGKRIIWVSNGGHLGNLYYVPVIKAITGSAGL